MSLLSRIIHRDSASGFHSIFVPFNQMILRSENLHFRVIRITVVFVGLMFSPADTHQLSVAPRSLLLIVEDIGHRGYLMA